MIAQVIDILRAEKRKELLISDSIRAAVRNVQGPGVRVKQRGSTIELEVDSNRTPFYLKKK